MLGRGEGRLVDEFERRREAAGACLVDPPGGEAAATGDEFEVRGLALLVCLLEHAGRERARRLIAYLVKRYATCPRCGADMGGKA
jgi:hypothetical protein